jgi:hypothetical protein
MIPLLLVLTTAAYAVEPPAFPGAEGFGAMSKGGRGGKVLFVTNLNDAGPGSLRAACETPGPRIVVFRVAGIVDLKSTIRIKEPFLTIAGQSAPGDGICIRGHGIQIDADDVVVRFLRVRPGDIAGDEVDALSVGGNSRRVIIDHCSTSWSVDENLSPSGNIAGVTVQWCVIAESLNRSVHKKGAHGYGSLVRAAGGVTLHHNLWAHNHGRNPRLGDNYGRPPRPTLDIRNNVMYNYEGLSVVGDFLDVNYAGNYLEPGPSARPGKLSPTSTAEARFFFDGNLLRGRRASPEDLFTRIEKDGRKYVELVQHPFEAAPVAMQPAADAFRLVLDHAGATAPVRDAVDARIVAQVRSGAGRIIDSQRDVSGWPEYKSAPAPKDTDEDGMPDDIGRSRTSLTPGTAPTRKWTATMTALRTSRSI